MGIKDAQSVALLESTPQNSIRHKYLKLKSLFQNSSPLAGTFKAVAQRSGQRREYEAEIISRLLFI